MNNEEKEKIFKAAERCGCDLRQCVVKCESGLFHGWFQSEDIVLAANVLLREDRRLQIIKCLDDKIIPSYCDLKKVIRVFGIVEFDDGTVKEVNPEDIRFCKESDD